MAKEVKIGLGVIAALLLVFGVVLFIRLRDPGTSVTADRPGKIGAGRSDDKKPAAGKPKLASGPKQPVKVAADQPVEDRSAGAGLGDLANAGSHEENNPADNYMPDPDSLQRDRYPDRYSGQSRDRYATKQGQAAADASESADEGEPTQETGDHDDSDEQFDPYGGDGEVGSSDDDLAEPGSIDATQADLDLTGADAAELDPGAAQHERGSQDGQGEELGKPVEEQRPGSQGYRSHTGLAMESRAAAPKALARSPRPVPVDGNSRTGSYTVEPNDSFWSISEKAYGSGSYFKALEAHNRQQFPDGDQIAVGDTVSVPEVAVLEQTYPNLVPKRRGAAGKSRMVPAGTATHGGRVRVYAVQEGDTLFDIARFELGRAARWAEIYDLNREQLGADFNYLAPGMELVLPDDQPQPDPVASDPKKPYRR